MLGTKEPSVIKKELNQLLDAARNNKEDERTLKLAKRYFNYATFLQEEKDIQFGSDAFSYFFLHHEKSPSENIASVPELKDKCRIRIVKLLDPDGLVEEVTTGQRFVAQKKFRPGAAIIEYMDKMKRLVLMNPPSVYILNEYVRGKLKKRFEKINFQIGPIVDIQEGLYLTHWNTICYKLQDEDITKLKKMGVLTHML